MGINLLVVLGLSLLTGFTGLFSFGNAGFMAIGGYTAVLLTTRLGVPFLPALLLGGVAAALFASLIGKITLNLKGDYFCIATLGMGESIRLFLNNIQYFGGSRGIPGIPQLTHRLARAGLRPGLRPGHDPHPPGQARALHGGGPGKRNWQPK